MRVHFLCQACEAWRPMTRVHEESGETIPLLGRQELEALAREQVEPPIDYAPIHECEVGHELCDACADRPCRHPSCRAYRASNARRNLGHMLSDLFEVRS